jgi:hypothetical protein
VIATQLEIDLVCKGKRTQLLLPLKRGPLGEMLGCPVAPGRSYRLQPKPFVKGTWITVTHVVRVTLDELTDTDARREGHFSAAGARHAWEQAHGTGVRDVWVVTFVRGERTDFYRSASPRWLRRNMGSSRGDYTLDPAEGAAGEGDALTAEEQAVVTADARAKDASRAWQPIRGRGSRLEAELRELREELTAIDGDKSKLDACQEKVVRLRRREINVLIRSRQKALDKLTARLTEAA